ENARVLVDAPAVIVSKVRDHELHGLERAVSVVPRSPHTGVAKTDDVRAAISREIGQETRVLLHHPPRTEVEPGRDHVGRLTRAVPVVQGSPDAVEAEADDICAAVSRKIRNESGLLCTPALTAPAHLLLLAARSNRRRANNRLTFECCRNTNGS